MGGLGWRTRVLRVPTLSSVDGGPSRCDTLVDASDVVDQVKVVKSAPEIAHIRRAAELTERGHDGGARRGR